MSVATGRSLRLLGLGFLFGLVLLGFDGAVALAAEDGHGGSMGIMSPNVAALLLTIAIFLGTMAVLWKFAWGPLLKALDDRERRIRDSLEAADRAREESRQAAVEHERILAEARREASAIVEEGKRDAQVVKDGIVSEARSEAESLKNRTLADIERAKNNAVYEIHDRAVELSYAIAERIIGKALSKEDHDALIKETIQRYEQLKGAEVGS